jgi:hypothetical protein
MLFDRCHYDYHTISSSSAAPVASFTIRGVVLVALVDVTPVVFLELVTSVVVVVDGWDELDDTLNPSHDVVTIFIFTAGAPLAGRTTAMHARIDNAGRSDFKILEM